MKKGLFAYLLCVVGVIVGIVIGVSLSSKQVTVPSVPTVEEPEITWYHPTRPIVADPPPDVIKVGPFNYTVMLEYPDEIPGYFGLTDHIEHVIKLKSTMEPGNMRETLWHEVTHAALMIGTSRGEWKPQTEDQFIEASSPTQVMVMRDNPKLMDWLTYRQSRNPVTIVKRYDRGHHWHKK